MRLRKFDDGLAEKLRDPDYAAVYAETALEMGGIAEFLDALQEVARATEGGMQWVAAETGHGRESLYKSLSKDGNPRVKTLAGVLDVLGLKLAITRRDVSPDADRHMLLHK